MIRLLYAIDGLRGGGKERQLVEIIKALTVLREFRIGVITFNRKGQFSEVVKNSVDYYDEISKKPDRIKPFRAVVACFRRFRPDIVHTWDSLSSLYVIGPSVLFKTKWIDGGIRDAGIEKSWQRALKRFLVKRADLVIANSAAGLDAYQVEGHVVYNAIDTGRFKTRGRNTGFNMVMTANFTDYKDHRTVLESSVVLVREKVVDHVYLIGDGVHRRNCESWIRGKGPSVSSRVHFTGAVGNVEDFLAFCDVGVLCSTSEYREGLSNSVLEYMAAGLVPVATDVGGTREIIEEGKNGFLIPPADTGALIRAVRRIREDRSRAERMRRRARSTVVRTFDYRSNIERLVRHYRGLIR